MSRSQPAEGFAADWTVGWRGVSLGWRAAFRRLPEQFASIVFGLAFQMSQVLITASPRRYMEFSKAHAVLAAGTASGSGAASMAWDVGGAS